MVCFFVSGYIPIMIDVCTQYYIWKNGYWNICRFYIGLVVWLILTLPQCIARHSNNHKKSKSIYCTIEWNILLPLEPKSKNKDNNN